MNKIFRTTLLAAIFAVPAAQADQRFYVGAAAGLTGGEATVTNGVSTFDNINDPRPFRLNAGYNINPRFAVELGYLNSGEFKFDVPPRVEMSVLSVALKGTIPFGEKWALTGKLGMARQTLDFKNLGADSFSVKDTSAMFSFGGEYRFTPQVAATLDFANYGKSGEGNSQMHARQIELGLQYSF